MYRQKRQDTLVGSVEDTYGINLNARRDMMLGTLLEQRGFDSLSQLLKAARGQLTYHPRARSLFLSFHHKDLAQVNGFRLMMKNKHLQLDVSDDDNRYPVNSEQSTYVKRALRVRIRDADVLVCMIGNGTAWREWVDWELNTAIEERTGICGIRLKGARSKAPEILHEMNAGVAPWETSAMTAAIERAAALRG
jgi:hypothetical protein